MRKLLFGIVLAICACGEPPKTKLDFISQECKDVQVKDTTGAFINLTVCSEKFSLPNGCSVVESKTDANGDFNVGIVCYKENQPPKQ